jgi:hypothetical protein
MERAMSLGAVPDDGEVCIDGMWHAGRQLRAASGVPVAWVSDRALGSGLVWAGLAEESAESGLQPFLLSNLDDATVWPELTAERFRQQVGEPEDTAAIDRMDAAEVLEGWWWAPNEDEFAEDDELRELFAPFGTRFPGLAPAIEEDLDAELMRRAIMQYTRHARIGLVPAARPADILPRLGWAGASNHRTASELAVVLRSWGEVRRTSTRGGLRRHPAAGQQAAAEPGGCAADRGRAFRVQRRGPAGLALDRADCTCFGEQPVLGLLVGLTIQRTSEGLTCASRGKVAAVSL